MSISGLHITMMAGLAFGFVSFFWRRNPALMMRFLTLKAATIAGVIVALIHSLVAGFSVPSQRTLIYAFSVYRCFVDWAAISHFSSAGAGFADSRVNRPVGCECAWILAFIRCSCNIGLRIRRAYRPNS
jgi:hypothetical protein